MKRKSTVDLISSHNSDSLVNELTGQIQCEHPNERLLAFEGRINLSNVKYINNSKNPAPLSMNQMALRGSVLRNTEWVYALVIYTGLNTKIIKNLKPGKVKVSTLDKALNRLVIYAFFFNMIILGVSVGLEYINYSSLLGRENAARSNGVTEVAIEWYIGPQSSNGSWVGFF